MADSKWPEAFGVASTAVACAWILTPWDKVGPINWDALSAIGTLAAATAAVVVPLWQNSIRDREKRVQAAFTEWAIAQDVHRLTFKVKELGDDWVKNGRPPGRALLTSVTSQLEVTKQRTTDSLGLVVMGDLLNVVASLLWVLDARNDVEEREVQAGRNPAHLGLPVPGVVRSNVNRLSDLYEMTFRWMEKVLAQCQALNVQPINVVRGEGSVSIRFDADGR
jgi:hypothetical protein